MANYLMIYVYIACIVCISDSAILRRGNPVSYLKAKPFFYGVRKSGVMQFINHYNRVKDVQTPKFLWGDEMEYGVFRFNNKLMSYDIATTRGPEIQEILTSEEKNLEDLSYGCLWQPEYGSWMVEAVPRVPFDGFVSSLLRVEKSMQLRRKRLHAVLNSCEISPSMTSFPLLGVPGLDHSMSSNDIEVSGPSNGEVSDPMIQLNNVSLSSYVRDIVINPHPRFGTLTTNIRLRRGRKVDIRVPKELPGVEETDKLIEMDAMAFGMGCCCLQVTLQSSSDQESRFLHDQLAVVSPLFLALSAATPIFKGELASTDTRWDVISQSVDDRTLAESGELQDAKPDNELAGGGVKRINKSRYSSVSRFIGKASSQEEASDLEALNNIDANFDEEFLQLLKSNKLDDSLAKHIAHLFIRDPLVIFDDAIHLDDSKALDHFENIQSTNWRTIRWKTPSLALGLEAQKRKKESSPFLWFGLKKNGEGDQSNAARIESFGQGWRVEFRPLEIQLTDFENAAFSILVVLLTRSILAMGYNFYMPMSYVEENMRRAQLKDAVTEQEFYFRRQAFDGLESSYANIDLNNTSIECNSHRLVPKLEDIEIIELTIDEIFNGSPNGVKGIIPSVIEYLTKIGENDLNIFKLSKYLKLLSNRASGRLPTAAHWMRSFVKNHPKYMSDGKVSLEVASDLMATCDDIGMGRMKCPELLGDVKIDRLCTEDAKEIYLASSIPPKEEDAESDDSCNPINGESQ